MLDVPELQLVQAIHEEGTLTGAAQRLYRSQSALSQRLQGAEDKLGAELFKRGGREMTLTPVGERILQTATKVLSELERAEADAEQIAEGRMGRLRLATQCYACYHWFPSLLKAYRARFPAVDVRIVAEATPDPLSALHEESIDIAVVTKSCEQVPDVQAFPLFDDEMIALVHADHPWGNQDFVDAPDFADQHVLLSTQDPTESLLYKKVLLPADLRPKEVTTLPLATSAAVELAKARMGVAIIERWAASSFTQDTHSLSAVQITSGGLWRTWYAATTKNADAPHYLSAFIEELAAVDVFNGYVAPVPS